MPSGVEHLCWHIHTRRTAIMLDPALLVALERIDAAMAAIAERMRVGRIYTLDRRNFELVRAVHVPQFEILP